MRVVRGCCGKKIGSLRVGHQVVKSGWFWHTVSPGLSNMLKMALSVAALYSVSQKGFNLRVGCLGIPES